MKALTSDCENSGPGRLTSLASQFFEEKMSSETIIRMGLDSLEKKSDDFISAMKTHGFVVLTDIGDEGEGLYGARVFE
jgi:hypothetical protein